MDERWTDEEEDFLRRMEQQCDVLYKHHTTDFKYYHLLSSRFNIPILVVSAINSLTAIALTEFVPQKFVSIMNAILSAGTGVLGSIQLYMKLNEKTANALRSATLFKRLGLKISRELTLARKDRSTEGQAFLSECFSEMNAAIEQGNPVEKIKMPNFLTLTPSAPSQPTSPVVLRSVADSLLRFSRSQSDSPVSDSV
jgi:hypothetical protein